ncbi:MAG: DUF4097 family beta strand repeat-containing protein, partial [Candidatus Sulfotelmatobacter sp.]
APLLLIGLGLIFLARNVYPDLRLLDYLAKFWPLLLILWGVIKLIEYQQAQRDGVPARGIGAGGIFLLICIVVCGLIATQASRFNWANIRDNLNIDDGDVDNFFGQTYNYDNNLERDLTPAITSLSVHDDHGAVRVSVADNNKITVTVRKRVGADSQNDADRYNGETMPVLSATGAQLTLDARTQASGDHGVQSDLDISIPRKMALQITSRRGDVSVTGRDGEVDINNQRGDVSVENVTGNVKLNLDRSSATVEQIAGDVHIGGELDEVSVTDVNGAVQLDGGFTESVKLANISRSVTFKDSRTEMDFSRIDGDLDLDSDDLHADQITGPLHLTTRDKEIQLEDVSGDVRLQNENGGIEISMRSLGNVQIDNRNGDIQLSVPEKAGFRVDASTRDGEIQSDFPELKIDNGDHESRASGSVGNGASHIVLNTEHDGIEIRKASPQPPQPPRPPARALPPPKTKVEPTEN